MFYTDEKSKICCNLVNLQQVLIRDLPNKKVSNIYIYICQKDLADVNITQEEAEHNET